MTYKLCEIESKHYEIHILQYPFPNQHSGRRKTYKNRGGGNEKKATEQCKSILVNVYGIDENYITEERGNIYCPFHENKRSSNSPSGRFKISKHSYTCYSTQCPLKGIVPIHSIELLKRLRLKRN